MKVNLTVNLDDKQRKVLKKYIGKSKGISHQDYRNALISFISRQIDFEKAEL